MWNPLWVTRTLLLSENNFPINQDFKAYTIHINICGKLSDLKKFVQPKLIGKQYDHLL